MYLCEDSKSRAICVVIGYMGLSTDRGVSEVVGFLMFRWHTIVIVARLPIVEGVSGDRTVSMVGYGSCSSGRKNSLDQY